MAKVRAAGLFLVNKDNKILVGHPTNHDPNFWSIPKGKIDGAETPLEAAIRETYEETNIKLLETDYNFIYIGKFTYSHKKKDISIFVINEGQDDNWLEFDIKCNSNVPEDRGGFPEMDDFKWVSIDEAKGMLHKTQIDGLNMLEGKFNKNSIRYKKNWCVGCEDFVEHRQKLSAILTNNLVCNKCDSMNPISQINE